MPDPHAVDSLDQAHAYRLQRLGRMLRYHLLSMLQPFELTPEQFMILFRLREHDGQVQKALVDPAFDDRANITHLVNQLEGTGLVRRARDAADGRKRRVWLTDEGRNRIDTVLARAQVVRTELFDGFTGAELDLLMRFVERLEDRLGAG